MTLILEFKNKLIFYKPGILRYAMRQTGAQVSGLQNRAQRRQLLSQSLKRGWRRPGPSWRRFSGCRP
jgi:hypothetical protein